MNWLPSLRREETSPAWSTMGIPSFDIPISPERPAFGHDWTEKGFSTTDVQFTLLGQPVESARDPASNMDTGPVWQYPCFGSSATATTGANHLSASPPLPPPRSEIRCYEHGCGGRRFSSMGNYRRHIKEQNGLAKTFSCDICGKSFTRSTAKNEHQKKHFELPDPMATCTSFLGLDMAIGDAVMYPGSQSQSPACFPMNSGDYIYAPRWPPPQNSAFGACNLDMNGTSPLGFQRNGVYGA